MRAAHETRELAGRRAGGYWTAAADRCLSIVTSIQYCRLGGLELSHSERPPLGCLDAFPLAQPEPRRHGWTRSVTTWAAANVVSALSHPEQPSHWPTTPRFQPEWPATWVAALVSAPDWTRGWMAAPPPSQLQWRGSSAASTRPCGRPARGDRGVMPCAWIRTASATTAIASGRRGAAPGPAACVFFFPRCRATHLQADQPVRPFRPTAGGARENGICV